MPEAFGLRAKFRSWRRAASFFVKSSTSYRSYRNTREFPGLGMDATVNREIGGCLEYGTLSSIGQGCNIVVPKGANLKIGHKCYIGRYVELGPSGKIEIGDRTSIQDRCTLVGDVSLGRYCMLSLNVMMASGNHTFNEWPHLLIKDQEILLSTPDELARNGSRQIMVEDDCWLGVNSVILPGVTVGKGCIVGANSVVSKNLPPYVVAVGAPARIAHLRFTFVPPAAIDWLNPHDYPYFYRGFKLAKDERQAARHLQGHVALSEFAVWLATAPTGKVVVKARSTGGSVAVVSRSGEEAAFGDDWSCHTFSQSSVASPMSFCSRGGELVVNGAWTE